MLAHVIAACPAAPPDLVSALVAGAELPGHSTRGSLARVLVTRADLNEHDLRLLLALDPSSIIEALSVPGMNAERAAQIADMLELPPTSWNLPQLPDPNGSLAQVLATRWGRRRDTWTYILGSVMQNPDARAAAALNVASWRNPSAAAIHQVAHVWYTQPRLHDDLRTAARSALLRRRLDVLTSLAGTRWDTHPTGSISWLSHPDTPMHLIVETVLARRSERLWQDATTWVHDPQNTLAAALAAAPFLADRPLMAIVEDASRPAAVRARALRTVGAAHDAEHLPELFADAAIDLMVTMDATTADTVAAVCPRNRDQLVRHILARDDNHPQRLDTLMTTLHEDDPWLRAAHAPILALHPAASREQRTQGVAMLRAGRAHASATGTRERLDEQWFDLMTDLGTALMSHERAHVARRLPVPRLNAPWSGAWDLFDDLAAATLHRELGTLTPGASRALVALAAQFTGTLGQLLDTCRAISA